MRLKFSKRGGTGITNRRLASKIHGGANRQQRPALFAALPGAAPGCSPIPRSSEAKFNLSGTTHCTLSVSLRPAPVQISDGAGGGTRHGSRRFMGLHAALVCPKFARPDNAIEQCRRAKRLATCVAVAETVVRRSGRCGGRGIPRSSAAAARPGGGASPTTCMRCCSHLVSRISSNSP
jgi:hypothetical protein